MHSVPFSGFGHGASTSLAGPVRSRLPQLLQSGHGPQQEDPFRCPGVPSCDGFGPLAEEVEV